ncbi:hypothetical protein FQN53_007340 [Emmonsiellopsis sp. PD_33]|nr:hypothetical protein FQN53_007340 [Emmonsiellopsis sp. PD_33]
MPPPHDVWQTPPRRPNAGVMLIAMMCSRLASLAAVLMMVICAAVDHRKRMALWQAMDMNNGRGKYQFDPLILKAQHVGFIMSCFILPYHLLSTLLSFSIWSPLLIFFGLIDAAVWIILLFPVAIHGKYLPGSSLHCEVETTRSYYQNAPSGKLIFFEALADAAAGGNGLRGYPLEKAVTTSCMDAAIVWWGEIMLLIITPVIIIATLYFAITLIRFNIKYPGADPDPDSRLSTNWLVKKFVRTTRKRRDQVKAAAGGAVDRFQGVVLLLRRPKPLQADDSSDMSRDSICLEERELVRKGIEKEKEKIEC